MPPFELDPDATLKLGELASFLRQPARYFFRRRLGVSFEQDDVVGEDEEPFALNALERYFLEDCLLDHVLVAITDGDDEPPQELTGRAAAVTSCLPSIYRIHPASSPSPACGHRLACCRA